MQGSGEVGLRSGGATPTPLINKERGIKVGFICLRLHHPTRQVLFFPSTRQKNPTPEKTTKPGKRKIVVIQMDLEIFLYRSTFTAVTASSPLFNQPSSHGTAVGQGPDLLAEEPLSHGTTVGQGPDLIRAGLLYWIFHGLSFKNKNKNKFF